ncbi:MAG TPA: UDP-N-acetylmuramate dehydrogenase [Rectinemataceae bacterium]|nr:UDP-N-acetylmuramate dehydrogenase [Rectinemataceae bacterium]
MPTLRDFLEKINIRAEIGFGESMASHCSFGIGGPADAFVRPLDAEAAAELFAAARAEGIPLFVLGGGANILVGDRGIRGIVLDMGGLAALRFEALEDGRVLLAAGAGLDVDDLCLEALCRGLGGLEDFAGMPGTVGGSAFMNARCYEREFSQVLAWVESAGAGGKPLRRTLDPSEWAYKRSPYQPGGARSGELILAAAFSLAPAEPAALAAAMRGRRADREAKGHYRLPSAGSVFKNDRALGAPTGKILDELGFRGRRIGAAAVSDWHANIFVNTGGAAAADMRALIELARDEARSRLGVELEPEVLMVGEF